LLADRLRSFLEAFSRCLALGLGWLSQPGLSRVTQQRVTFCANFLRLSELTSSVNSKCGFFEERWRTLWILLPSANPAGMEMPVPFCSHSADCQNNETTRYRGAEHSAPELLHFNCSGLGLESDWPLLPGSQPRSKHLDCVPSSLSDPVRSYCFLHRLPRGGTAFLLLNEHTPFARGLQVWRNPISHYAPAANFPKAARRGRR
jgi:hypothetical protein